MPSPGGPPLACPKTARPLRIPLAPCPPDARGGKTSGGRRKHLRGAFGRWTCALDDCDRLGRGAAGSCQGPALVGVLARFGFGREE